MCDETKLKEDRYNDSKETILADDLIFYDPEKIPPDDQIANKDLENFTAFKALNKKYPGCSFKILWAKFPKGYFKNSAHFKICKDGKVEIDPDANIYEGKYIQVFVAVRNGQLRIFAGDRVARPCPPFCGTGI